METSSHRLRLEQKKLYKKILITISIFIVFVVLMIFAGFPLLAKVILVATSFNRDIPVTLSQKEETSLTIPVLDPIPESTNTATISVSGYGEKNADIKILVNGKEAKKAKSDTDGKFLVVSVPIKEGDNKITAISILDDNESSPSGDYSVSYKNKPPKLDVVEPHDGDKFSSDKKEIVISGSTDSGNRLTLNGRYVIVNSSGNFKTTYSLSDGDNELKFEAQDEAGNKIEKKIKVIYYP